MDNKIKIPDDLKTFLVSKEKLVYDANNCEAGKIILNTFDELEVCLVPTDIDNAEFMLNDEIVYGNIDDPHYQEMGCYLIPAINLINSCEHYEPFGLLLWLPKYNSYSIWDNSHILLKKFSENITWTDIKKDFSLYINAGWGQTDKKLETILPWPDNQYSSEQIYEPISIKK
ncbi:hypothetical protein [Vallitalea maricola]|uniref:Uncharacterized protein n=1 Tax=Vallitalea maricola TaxID=3074433 RepID=A0ACB5ULI3_9FIRM|nr:hypothetical protein AN2V17_30570 [Vallitalea sp. AN17-2]